MTPLPGTGARGLGHDPADAFQAHRNVPHFPVWRRAAAECVDEQVNTATSLVFPGDG